ncbi:PREDICTED: mitochondrial ribonuclease P protein 1 [Nanorana parkeri]|uniref:mitochondrial ribonuclease P protein 1 n=1 Tax=Nanorana parkeri TaxID=125878 RepID=UPI0008545475|nr:PREDICTED: mitochondrial ribonuclease P protein 1 [Nanorana parkeri]
MNVSFLAFTVLCSSFKMAFMNAVLRNVRSSTFPLSIRRCINKQLTFEVCYQLSQCRMLMLTHGWRSQNKPTATETLNLDSWKDILRSGTQSTIDQEESDTQEESSIESMQKLVDMWRLAGKSVPDSVSTEELQELLKLPTKSSRKKYLKELMFKEFRKKSRERKKLEKQTLRSEMEGSTEKISTYLLKLFSSSEDSFYGWRTVQSMIHGQPLVFDMVYDRYMSQKEIENTVSQLMMSVGSNKISGDPFHIHFCNLQPGGPYHKELVKRYQEAWDKLLITATEKSHIDIFPRDRLVYLTADSPNVIKEFDHEKIYIVGAFVDKCQKTGVSLGIAKRLNLATARLPLDNYLKWDIGAKNLTLNQMIEILMATKDTGDWKNALSFVPTRKHSGFLEKPLSQKSKSFEGRRAGGPQRNTSSNSANQMQSKWWEEIS